MYQQNLAKIEVGIFAAINLELMDAEKHNFISISRIFMGIIILAKWKYAVIWEYRCGV